MLRVIAYTGGVTVPSARFRVRQYIPRLQDCGVDMRECPARFGSYPPANRLLRPGWGVAAVAERFSAAFRSHAAQLTLLQREMLSTFATAERFTRAPRVLDVDDAIWLSRGGRFAVAIARLCQTVICGNPFIAEFFEDYARHVVVLPTPVDTDRFRPIARAEHGPGVICWSGTRSGMAFLHTIEMPLAVVLAKHPERRLRVVSDAPPRFHSLPSRQVEFVRWSEDREVAAIQDATVAIMPLDDSPWARGKCSYKLLTYMACGLPVVATPVGMNAEVLSRGHAGFAARSSAEWADALEWILSNPERAGAMGAAGREVVVREYSLGIFAGRLAAILHSAAGN